MTDVARPTISPDPSSYSAQLHYGEKIKTFPKVEDDNSTTRTPSHHLLENYIMQWSNWRGEIQVEGEMSTVKGTVDVTS